MRKITFVGLEAEKERFLERLQQVGGTHLIHSREAVEAQDLARELQRVVEARKFLAKKGQKGKPEKKLDARQICSRREELGHLEARLVSEIGALRKERVAAEPWGDFNAEDLEALRNKGLHVQFYRVPRKIFESLPLGEILHQVTRESAAEVCFVTFSSEPVELGVAPERPPARSAAAIDLEISYKQAKLEEIEKEYAALAEHLEALEKAEAELTDLLEHRRAVLNARRELDNRLFVVQCWSPVPADELLGRIGSSFLLYHYVEDPRPEERVPVLLQNPPTFDSGEDLVKVYSYPSYNDFDPSPFVLYCFAVFFGMIVGDAGYGLVLLGLTWWLRRRFPSRSPFAVRFFRLLYVLSASVIAFGVITASYFGVKLNPQSPLLRVCLFDMTTKEGQNQVMILSILMGMAHISLSQLIKFRLSRNWSCLGWIVVIWAGYFLIQSRMGKGAENPVALYGLIAGLAIVFLFSSTSRSPLTRIAEGLQGLIGIVQIFGDILSYLRLFALGIATVYMAQTFNMLGGRILESMPFVGVVLAALVLLAGHGINFLLAMMGGVIHGLRLNFLEWYRWCFEGDGLPFRPFQRIAER